ncbi:MAG TPA: exodeoxyribonuclease III [Candidatus Saccharimonadales bacterium]|nr:exodeoxyribonuclease III [Candidatus Saccharimonadales bacterium]
MTQVKLYSWNVNGIRAVIRKESLTEFFARHQPDILCLQETKVGKDAVEVETPGYEQYWNSAAKPGYSGTAIFSKTKPLKVTNGFPEGFASKYNFVDHETRDAAGEGRVIAAEFDKFYVVTVYTPNAKDDLSRIPLRHEHWDPAFLAYCQELEKTKPVVFCGDLNVAHTPDDLARPKENEGKKGFTAEEREGFDKFEAAGFIDTFRLFTQGNGFYTWWSAWGGARERNVGWRIDYFMASKQLKDKVIEADIHPDIMGSDHCPISVTLDL